MPEIPRTKSRSTHQMEAFTEAIEQLQTLAQPVCFQIVQLPLADHELGKFFWQDIS